MFSKLLYIANISRYKKRQLKLHRSLLGVKGGGAKTAPSPTLIAVTVKINILVQILVKSAMYLTNTL